MEASTSRLAIMAMLIIFAATGAAKTNSDHEHAVCGITMDDLFACRPAVVGPAALPPTATCCAALGEADLPCLCSFKSNKYLPALGIDPALAMQLPAKCNLLQSFHCA